MLGFKYLNKNKLIYQIKTSKDTVYHDEYGVIGKKSGKKTIIAMKSKWCQK